MAPSSLDSFSPDTIVKNRRPKPEIGADAATRARQALGEVSEDFSARLTAHIDREMKMIQVES